MKLFPAHLRWTAITLLLVLAAPVASLGQGPVEELDREIAELQAEKQFLAQQMDTLNDRLDVLGGLRAKRLEIERLEQQIEQAEQRGNEPLVEQLDKQIGVLEVDIQQLEVGLEFLEKRAELVEIRTSVREEELDELRPDVSDLFTMLRKGETLFQRLFQVYREGPESAAGELEEQLGVLEQEFERRLEIVHLNVALHFAQQESDDEAIEEIAAELRFFGELKDVLEEDFDPQSMTQPIVPSEDEVVEARELSFDAQIVPLLRRFCFDCHDTALAEGDLDLEKLVSIQPLVKQRRQWINVKQQLKVGSMPPPDNDQPNQAERRKLVAWLTAAIDRFDYQTVQSVGYEPARRLTHEEYNNTIRDLFGLDLRPADQFPVDLTASSGFENSANSLFIQPITMERYVGAAEEIVHTALPPDPDSPADHALWDKILRGDPPRQALSRFVRRAFRRPVDESELAPLLNHFDHLVQQNGSPGQALRESIQLVLVSPSFLIRSEEDRSQKPGMPFRISDHELANRVSYFLWASMPDAELMELAEAGKLGRPAVLMDQVERMLRDQKASTLGRIFASQWLGFANLNRVARDQIDNPWATDSLFDAMHEESAMLFNSLVRDDAPIERLIDADFTYLNEELARHYRIADVEGPQMRRVSLRGTHRGGLLGHASILAITSFPGRTSPVVRGNWVLSNLLGTPPPPPPPNVSEFDERVAENRKLTQKQKLQLHRRNPNCYACHSLIDPLGFALEEFDWYGRFRSERRGKPIDATGELPSGRQVNGLKGLREAIVDERRDDLIDQLTRKMLSYALGRQLHYYDEATIAQIVHHLHANGRRLQSLIRAIVASDTFQMKQIDPPSSVVLN